MADGPDPLFSSPRLLLDPDDVGSVTKHDPHVYPGKENPDESIDGISMEFEPIFDTLGNEIELDDLDEDFDITDELAELLIDDVRLSEQEEDIRIQALLLLARCLAYMGNQSWNFFVPVALSFAFTETILPAAIFATWTYIFYITTKPHIGQVVEKTNRLDVIRGSVLSKGIFLVFSGGLLWLITEIALAGDILENSMGFFSSAPSIIIFSSFLITCTLLQLGETAQDIAVEEEWISALYPIQRSPPLLKYLHRAKLVCQIISPLLVAPLFYFSLSVASCVLLASLLFLLLLEYFILKYILSKKEELQDTNSDGEWVARDLFPGNPLGNLYRSWNRLKGHILLLIILSNGLVSFWYLSMGMPLFLSYLAVEEVHPMWIGIFRSSVACASMLAVFVYPFFHTKVGLVMSSRFFVIISAFLAIGSILVIYLSHWIAFLSEILILHFVLSLYGCASKNMCNGLEVPVQHANESLQSMGYILVHVIGCIVIYPSLFSIFAWINAACVIIAATLFLFWGTKSLNTEYVTTRSYTDQTEETDDFS